MELDEKVLSILSNESDFVTLEHITKLVDDDSINRFDVLSSLYRLFDNDKIVKKLRSYNNNTSLINVWKAK